MHPGTIGCRYSATATPCAREPADDTEYWRTVTGGVYEISARQAPLKAGDESESVSAVAASSATTEPNHEHERDPILVAVLVLAVLSVLASIVQVRRACNSAQPIANNADAAPAGERRFNGSFDGEQMRKFSQADDFSSPRFSVSNI